jgi:hypothetical protein
MILMKMMMMMGDGEGDDVVYYQATIRLNLIRKWIATSWVGIPANC